MKSLTIPGIFAWTNPVFDCQAKAIILNILHWFLANATVLRERNVAAGFIDLFSITGVHRPIFPLELDRIRTDQALTFCLPPRPVIMTPIYTSLPELCLLPALSISLSKPSWNTRATRALTDEKGQGLAKVTQPMSGRTRKKTEVSRFQGFPSSPLSLVYPRAH